MNPVSPADPAVPLVRRTDRGDVACLWLCNPPVNLVHAALRRDLQAALDTVERDPAIRAVVICAEGRLFSGGGDPREIGRSNTGGPANLTGLAQRIEDFARPVVVAIHSKAVGGGVLLALACHARIAAPDASILLPEVKLAFPPPAGGTQRLPRLVGLAVALRMIALAQALDAPAAHAAGFFDQVVPAGADLVAAAVQRARAIAAGALPWRRTSALAVPPLPAVQREALAADCRRAAQERFPGREAAVIAIDLVLAAARLDFDSGLQQERLAYDRLANAPEARALIGQLIARRSGPKG